MVLDLEERLEQVENNNEEIVKSVYWSLPVSIVDTWRPYTAFLHYDLFYGPEVRTGNGLDLKKNIVGYWCGARGSTKSLSLSYAGAKELRAGKSVWANYPISFFVVEKGELTGKESRDFIQLTPCHWINLDGTLSYYETMYLDMDKYYKFHKDIRNGAVLITELQYFVEARTSGRKQNRLLGYQLMQIRKTANSFLYDVQNPAWVDNRFGWSADFECQCQDLAKKHYDRASSGRELEEGEISRWLYHDISGLMTGEEYRKTGREIGPFQFEGFYFWDIYPTHFIVDVFEAMNSFDADSEKKNQETKIIQSIETVLNEFLDQGATTIDSKELLSTIHQKLGEPVSSNLLGRYLASLGVEREQRGHNKFVYDFSELVKSKE